MKEAYIIQINGSNNVIKVSCLAEARYKARKFNGRIIGQWSSIDFSILKQIITVFK